MVLLLILDSQIYGVHQTNLYCLFLQPHDAILQFCPFHLPLLPPAPPLLSLTTMTGHGFAMFGWSWIEGSDLGSQVFGQASIEGCDSSLNPSYLLFCFLGT